MQNLWPQRETRVGLIVAMLGWAAVANAQVLVDENFDDEDSAGWLANGNTMFFPDYRPGSYIGVPYDMFFTVSLRFDSRGDVTGDLTRHNGDLAVSVEAQVLALDNSWGDPLDPTQYPVVLQLFSYGDPDDPFDDCSVYAIGSTLPDVPDGWKQLNYHIPVLWSGQGLPAGWGGTGDSDPDTGAPTLPSGRTWRSVISSVDEFTFTTSVPGYFYGGNFWDMGWDNVRVERVPGCAADFNADGFVDDTDFVTFAQAYDAFACSGSSGCAGDLNGDGFVDDTDFVLFAIAYDLYSCDPS